MNNMNKKRLINFILVTLFSFLLIFFGIRYVLDNEVTMRNVLGYLGFSLVLALISTALYILKPKVAYLVFLLGIVIGYISMYRSFFSDLNGWEELGGLMSLFVWILIGLGAGLVLQLVIYLYRKYKKN